VSVTPVCMSQQCHWHRCAYHSGVNQLFSNIFMNNLTHCFFYKKSDSAAHGTAVSMTPLWHAHCTAVSLTLLWLAQQCQWHHCGIYRGVNDTAVQIWHCCDFWPHIQEALAAFKGNIYQKNIHR
jgi:hypothetical protein